MSLRSLGKAGTLIVVAGIVLLIGAWMAQDSGSTANGQPATPAQGYTVHVTAPHLVNGHDMGPYHHYSKVIGPEQQIVCLIFDSTESNAPLPQIEFIEAKKLTRPAVKLNDWNRLWHDHAVEIAGGRVQVLDLPPDKAKEVADLVATTDGIIYSFEYNGKLPTGKITMAQAVGHKPLSAQEYEQSRKVVTASSAGAH